MHTVIGWVIAIVFWAVGPIMCFAGLVDEDSELAKRGFYFFVLSLIVSYFVTKYWQIQFLTFLVNGPIVDVQEGSLNG